MEVLHFCERIIFRTWYETHKESASVWSVELDGAGDSAGSLRHTRRVDTVSKKIRFVEPHLESLRKITV